MKQTIKKYIPQKVWQGVRSFLISIRTLLENLGPSIRTVNYCGYDLYYNSGNSIIRRLRDADSFESGTCDSIEQELKKHVQKNEQAVLLDIGANLGLISLRVARNVPQAHIYAFEPGPKQYSLLKKTLDANNLSARIHAANVALSDTTGTQKFFIHPKRDMAKDGLRDTKRGESTIAIEVKTMTADAWWMEAGKPRIDVVKIDTEGAELLVLRGATNLLMQCRPAIILEIESLNLRAYPYAPADIVRFLGDKRYTLRTLDGLLVTNENIDAVIETGVDTYIALPS